MDWLGQTTAWLRDWMAQQSWLDAWQPTIAATPDWALPAAAIATPILLWILLRLTWPKRAKAKHSAQSKDVAAGGIEFRGPTPVTGAAAPAAPEAAAPRTDAADVNTIVASGMSDAASPDASAQSLAKERTPPSEHVPSSPPDNHSQPTASDSDDPGVDDHLRRLRDPDLRAADEAVLFAAGQLSGVFGVEDKEAAIEAYERAVSHDPNHSHAWHQLGILYQEQSRTDAAVDAYEKALSTAANAGEEGVALCGLGNIAHDREDYAAAEDFQTRAAQKLEGIEDEIETRVRCVRAIANLKYRRGASDAERAALDARDLAKTHDLPEEELQCLHLLVGIATKRSNSADQERFLRESLALETRLDRKADQARSHHLLRALAGRRRDGAAAKIHGEQALALFRELENQEGIATELYLLGVIAKNNDEPERAYRIFEEALSIAEQIDLKRCMIDSLHKLGDLDYRRDRFDDAERWLSRALDLSTETGDVGAQALSLWTLGCVAEDRGDDARKRAYWTRARPLAEADGNTELVQEIDRAL